MGNLSMQVLRHHLSDLVFLCPYCWGLQCKAVGVSFRRNSVVCRQANLPILFEPTHPFLRSNRPPILCMVLSAILSQLRAINAFRSFSFQIKALFRPQAFRFFAFFFLLYVASPPFPPSYAAPEIHEALLADPIRVSFGGIKFQIPQAHMNQFAGGSAHDLSMYPEISWIMVGFKYPSFAPYPYGARAGRAFPDDAIEVRIDLFPQTEETFINRWMKAEALDVIGEELNEIEFDSVLIDEGVSRNIFPSGNRFIGSDKKGNKVFIRCYQMYLMKFCEALSLYGEGVKVIEDNIFIVSKFHFHLLPKWQDIHNRSVDIVDSYRLKQ